MSDQLMISTDKDYNREIMIRKVDIAKKLDLNKKKLCSAIFKEIRGRKWLGNYLSRTEAKIVTIFVYSNLDFKKYNPNGLKGFHVMKKVYFKDSRKSSTRKFAKKVTKKSYSQSTISKGSPRKVEIQSLSQLFIIICDINSKYSRKIPNRKIMSRRTKPTKKGHKDSYISLLQRKFSESSDLSWPFHIRTTPSSQNSVVQLDSDKVEVSFTETSDLSWPFHIRTTSSSQNSVVQLDSDKVEVSFSEKMPGWPLLAIQVPQTRDKTESPVNRSKIDILLDVAKSSPGCEIFEYEHLETATCQFSSENIIGEGGCSTVYKGNVESGKTLAVKVLKPYMEAWDDFSLQVKISSSIKHKHIVSLLGICLENGSLISVHDFFPRGNLEDYLHGDRHGYVLPWKVRFNVAVSIAEALDYLHNECSQPIIHRDVKSSNILLTDDFQPLLSDFGLAIWDSKDSVRSDVAGTIGYIAPEYFMYGKISEKIDIYAFGVVLLELLTGKRPIYYAKVSKGRESLVKWSEKLLQGGDYVTLIDPKLKGDFDVDQMKRMVLAAKLCVSQSPRVRPKASQVLRLLEGYNDFEEHFINSKISESKKVVYEHDDEDSIFGFRLRDCLSFEILDTDGENLSPSRNGSNTSTTTSSSTRKKGRVTLKDFLNQSQD